MAARPVSRLPLSHAIVWSDGTVTMPHQFCDDDVDEVEPDSDLLTQVLVAKDFKWQLVDLEDLAVETMH